MNPRHEQSIFVSSEQSAIETTNPNSSNTNTSSTTNNNHTIDAADHIDYRKLSFTDSDQHVSPVLHSDPFELDESLWSTTSSTKPGSLGAAAMAVGAGTGTGAGSVSTLTAGLGPSPFGPFASNNVAETNNGIDDNMLSKSSPNYDYSASLSNSASPIFNNGTGINNFGSGSAGSGSAGSFTLGSTTRNTSIAMSNGNGYNHDLQQQQQHQQQGQGTNSSRRASYLSSGAVWNNNQDLITGSRHSTALNKLDPIQIQSKFSATEVSPTWSNFQNMGNNDWKFPPQIPQPFMQQPQQQQQPNQAQMEMDPASAAAAAAAAARRHSYAAFGDRQWINEGFAGFMPQQEPVFMSHDLNYPMPAQNNHLQQQQQHFGPAPPFNGAGGHMQRLSADFGNMRVNSPQFNPYENEQLSKNQDSNHHPQQQQQESSQEMKMAYKAVDFYFSDDRHQRVHITDTGKDEDTQAALDALAKKGAQLPRFPGNAFPGAKLVLIGFKAGRVDVFYLPETSGMILDVGDLVVVEADRGQDLGKVLRMDVSIDEARLLKLRQHQEQQAALADNEQLISSGVLPPINTSANGTTTNNNPPPHHQQQQQQPQAQPIPALHFPKPILRFADPQQVSQVSNKISDEEKACRVCTLKVHTHGLAMHVVDAEYQWDRRKLTFYYAANQRIDFRELVKELFRVYKTRIWMCAVSGGMEAVLKHEKELQLQLHLQQQQQQQQQLHNNDTMMNNNIENNDFNWNELERFK